MTYFKACSRRVIQALHDQISKRKISLYGQIGNFKFLQIPHDIKPLVFETQQNSINTIFRNSSQVNTPTSGIVHFKTEYNHRLINVSFK